MPAQEQHERGCSMREEKLEAEGDPSRDSASVPSRDSAVPNGVQSQLGREQ